MKALHPRFDCTIHDGVLNCCGTLQPSAVSRLYQVRITFEPIRGPRASVLHPQLRRRQADEAIPHTFSENEPCLYSRAMGDWKADMKVATTMVGWLALWLLFYEAWLATGIWQGEGVEHRQLS